MTMHEPTIDAVAAKQRELGRLWLQQLASLLHDVGFKEGYTRINQVGARILMRDNACRELRLAVYNGGKTWSAHIAPGIDVPAEKTTGGVVRSTTAGLEAAQRRVFERLLR